MTTPQTAPTKRRTVTFFFTSCTGCAILTAVGTGMLVLLFWLLFTNSGQNKNPLMKPEMWSVTRDWARLAPLPSSAHSFQVETTGNMFTRGFKGSFVLPADALESWIAASPGLRDARILQEKELGKQVYLIKPAEGITYARVTIVRATGLVRFKVYAS